MKNQKGFTLIELTVVIAIIGLLASVVLVSVNKARVKSRDAKRIADVQQINKAMELYALDHGSQFPQVGDAYPVDDLGTGTCNGALPNGPVTDANGNGIDDDPAVVQVAGCGWCNRWCWLADALKSYIKKMPKDPINDSTHFYYYNSSPYGNRLYYGIGINVFEDSSDISKYSNPSSAVYPTGYELGPSVNYCSSKYSGGLASWHWTGVTVTCTTAACVCAGGN